MIDWAMRVGFRVPERLAYSRHGNPGAYTGRFRNDWEPLLWFQRPGAAGFFDKTILSEKAKHSKPVGSVLTGRRSDGSLYQQRVISEESANTKHRGTIWHYLVGHAQDDDGGTDHPATFCYRFAKDAVCCFCPPGGLVVDPFSGSGTSAVAAAKHGRRFFGGDLLARPSDGKPWAQVALERVAQATAQQILPLALSSDRNPR
jgi:DNA modification methylase